MRRFICSILALIFIVGSLSNIGWAAKDDDDDYDRSREEPRLYVTSEKTFTGDPGESIKVPIKIKNNSDFDAKNISVNVEIDGSNDIYIDGSGYDSISSISAGKSKEASFRVKIDENAKRSSAVMQVSISYENYDSYYTREYKTTEKIYIRVSNKTDSPRVVVKNVEFTPDKYVNAGDDVLVGFRLKNEGQNTAKDIKISLDGLSSEGFFLSNGLNNKIVAELGRRQTVYVYFELKSSDKIKSGSYPLEMNLSYKDEKDEEFEYKDVSKFFLNINSDKNRNSNLIMENIKYPEGPIGQNKEVDISFNIRNQGQTDAENIIIKAESTNIEGLVPKSVSTIKIDTLPPGETQEVHFKFLTTKSAETKNYPIEIKIEYRDEFLDDDEDPHTLNQYVGVFSQSPDDDNKSVPKLIIDKYNFEPQLVSAGQTFQMNLSFFNTNSMKSVKNIKIFLTSEGGTDPKNEQTAGSSVFTPVDSSNTFYIDSIPPKGRVQKAIKMFTVPDALARTHTITANFEYEDSKGEAYTATELIGVPVIQQSKLDVGEINYSPEAYVGESTPISVEFYNTGKVTLYNMMVKLEGDFKVENGQYYIGNFDSGTSESFEGYVIPNSEGELTGNVVFTYEDSTGQMQELKKEFTLNVIDMPPMDDEFGGEFPPMDDEKGGILKSKVFWGIIITIAATTTGVIIYKKKKKKKEMSLDE